MLADGGTLPLAQSVASDAPEGKRYRFGWRDAAKIAKAPDAVFSAACSSGATP